MPYFNDWKTKQESEKGNNDLLNFSKGGAGGGQAANPGEAAQGPYNPSNDTGSNFSSIDKYLGANQGSNFGRQFTDKVNQDQQEAVDAAQKATNQFKSSVTELNKTPTGEQIGGAIADPSTVSPDQYQGWMNQQYKNVDLGQDYWTKANEAAKKTQMLGGKSSDQLSLLESYFGNQGGKGNSNLNLAIANNSQGQDQRVKSLTDQSKYYKSQGLNQQKALLDLAQAQKGQVDNSSKWARSAIGVDENGQVIQGPGAGAIGNLESEINQNVETTNATNAALLEKIRADEKEGKPIDPAILAKLGLAPDQNTYGANLSSNIDLGPKKTAANVMTPEQLTRLKALQGMAGAYDTMGQTTLNDSGDPFQYRTGDTATAVGNAESKYNKAEYDKAFNESVIPLTGMDLKGGFLGTPIGAVQSPARNLKAPDLSQMISSINHGQPITVGGDFGYWLNNQSEDVKSSFARQAQDQLDKYMFETKKKYKQS